MDTNQWSEWRKSEVERAGNDPAAWKSVARNLIVSGAVLADTHTAGLRIMLRNVLNGGAATDVPRTAEEEATTRLAMQTHSVTLMLFGFAIECLLKAVYLSRGGILYRHGNYKSPQRLAKSHNLLEIAVALECKGLFTPGQCALLDHLSASNEMGRYPAHSRFDHYGLQPPDAEGKAKFYGFWNTSMSVQVYRVLRTLYAQFDETPPSAADALLEQRRVERASYGETDDSASLE